MIGGHFQIDVVQRLAFTVPGIQIVDMDSDAHDYAAPNVPRRTT